MKSVIYLDVDGVLLQFPEWRDKTWWDANNIQGCVAAPKAREFIRWAKKHFEIRWLTCWATSGVMRDISAERLAAGLGMEPYEISEIVNPLSWSGDKPDGIDWNEHDAGRLWVWIDDEGIPKEMAQLALHNSENNFLKTNTSKDPMDLCRTWRLLRERFNIND